MNGGVARSLGVGIEVALTFSETIAMEKTHRPVRTSPVGRERRLARKWACQIGRRWVDIAVTDLGDISTPLHGKGVRCQRRLRR